MLINNCMFRQPPIGYFKPFFRTARFRRTYADIRYDELDSIRTRRNAQLRKSRSRPPNARGITYWSMALFSWYGVSCDHGNRLRLLHARACDTFVVRSGDGGVVSPRDGGSDPMGTSWRAMRSSLSLASRHELLLPISNGERCAIAH
jgi:hypothetical protein